MDTDAAGKAGTTGATADEPAPRRGRPRDPSLDDAVLGATVELLAERGYAGLRVGDVAERAGSGLGALYRRWPGKRDLVLAALERIVPDRDLPVTDDARADLLAAWKAIADALAGPRGRLLGGLLPELRDDPDLADAVRRVVLSAVREANRDRLRRVLADDGARLDDADLADPDPHPGSAGARTQLGVLADLGPAYVLFQGVFLGRHVQEPELRSLLELVVRTARDAASTTATPDG
jgi:AcrR family transcriptional regulator